MVSVNEKHSHAKEKRRWNWGQEGKKKKRYRCKKKEEASTQRWVMAKAKWGKFRAQFDRINYLVWKVVQNLILF